MEQGDYGRAADDFRSAISAYNDQIDRGDNPDMARDGIATCRSGLRIAISNLHR